MPERLCMCKICSIFADAKEKRVMAGKSFYFVIQSWMLEDMQLPLGDAAVYAYIHGLTRSEVYSPNQKVQFFKKKRARKIQKAANFHKKICCFFCRLKSSQKPFKDYSIQ